MATAAKAKNFNPRAPYGARPSSIRAGDSGPGYFNPRAPYGARRRPKIPIAPPISNFNPRAPYGARPHLKLLNTLDQYDFNPRAPYGARHNRLSDNMLCNNISIHAPHTGRDRAIPPMIDQSRPFQSTRPIRGATGTFFDCISWSGFQSTRPIRGATAKMHNLCSAFLQ